MMLVRLGRGLVRVAVIGLVVWALASAGAATVFGQPPETAELVSNGVYRMAFAEYEVTVEVVPPRPTVGAVHFVVQPRLLEGGEGLTDAVVMVVVDDDSGEPAYESVASSTVDRPTDYRARVVIDRAGEWTVRVNVRMGGGDPVELSFPLHTSERASIGGVAGTIVFLVVLAVLVGIAGFLAYSARRGGHTRG